MRKLLSGLATGLALTFTIESAQAWSLTPPFDEAPGLGYDTSAQILLIIEPDGSLGMNVDTSQGPFDGNDDTLYGIVNLSTNTVYFIHLQSSATFSVNNGSGLFAFDGDGLCSGWSPQPAGCPFGPTGYEGPNTSYSSISVDQSSGNVNFPAGLAPGDATYFSLENAIASDCMPLTVPLYQQCASFDPQNTNSYGDLSGMYCGPNGTSTCVPGTIAYFGCQLACYTMTYNYLAPKSSQPTITPEILNAYLQTNNGYLGKYGTLIDPHVVAQFAAMNGVQMYWQGRVDGRNDFILDNNLCDGWPVTLAVTNPITGHEHFVLATGQTIVNGTNTWWINDPGNCSGNIANDTTLLAYGNTYHGMRLWGSSTALLSGLQVVVNSPVQVVLTDPNSNQTGFDPVTGTTFLNIAGSSYTHEQIEDDNGDGTTLPDVGILEALSANPGQYNLVLYGTGDGPYEIQVYGYDSNGNKTGTQTFSGTVTKGSVIVKTINYTINPVIVQTYPANDPQAMNDYYGSEAQLELTPGLASGFTADSTFQWLQNGQPLVDGGLVSGAQTPTLTLGSVTNTAQYTAVVNNSYGSFPSQAFTVTVPAPTAVTFKPGTYVGLFVTPDEISVTNSGAFNLLLSAAGKFTGNVTFGTHRDSFSGKFNAKGFATITNQWAGKKGPRQMMYLQMDDTPGLERIAGTLADDGFVAGITSFLGGPNSQSPAFGMNRYTLALSPGETSAAASPAGWGGFTGTLSSSGRFSLTGYLADGTRLNSTMNLSTTTGLFPLFEPLYGNAGILIGWLTFANGTVSGDSITWIRPPRVAGQTAYEAGFNLSNESVIGSPYVAPAHNGDALVLPNNTGYLELTDGNLSQSLTNMFTLSKDKVTVLNNANKIKVQFNATTGAVSGSFTPPGSRRPSSLMA